MVGSHWPDCAEASHARKSRGPRARGRRSRRSALPRMPGPFRLPPTPCGPRSAWRRAPHAASRSPRGKRREVSGIELAQRRQLLDELGPLDALRRRPGARAGAEFERGGVGVGHGSYIPPRPGDHKVRPAPREQLLLAELNFDCVPDRHGEVGSADPLDRADPGRRGDVDFRHSRRSRRCRRTQGLVFSARARF